MTCRVRQELVALQAVATAMGDLDVGLGVGPTPNNRDDVIQREHLDGTRVAADVADAAISLVDRATVYVLNGAVRLEPGASSVERLEREGAELLRIPLPPGVDLLDVRSGMLGAPASHARAVAHGAVGMAAAPPGPIAGEVLQTLGLPALQSPLHFSKSMGLL